MKLEAFASHHDTGEHQNTLTIKDMLGHENQGELLSQAPNSAREHFHQNNENLLQFDSKKFKATDSMAVIKDSRNLLEQNNTR